MSVDTYEMAITLAMHANDYIVADDDGGFDFNIAVLKKLLQQLLDIAKELDDPDL